MANDYLVSKWRNFFGFFDHNQKGKVCNADMETARSKFTSLHNLEGEQKQNVSDTFTRWWVEYVMWGKQEITVDEFVGKQNAAFKADKEAFAARMRQCEETINTLIGHSENGYESVEDLMIFSKAVGQGDEEKAKKLIQGYIPNRNKVPVKEMVEMWTHHMTSEDSLLPDPCQKALAEFFPK